MRDFGFAFNDDVFADRVLRIEISGTSVDSNSDYEFCHHNVRKRKLKNDKETGDTQLSSCDSNSECSDGVEVKTLYASSPILAETSVFFYKMFKNGMRESQEKQFTLKINANEEVALMDLLKFMYTNTLSATTAPDLLNVLMIADKFGVVSCMRYCCDLLMKLPMSVELALLYLHLPSSVLKAEAAQPIQHAAKCYLSERYKDFDYFKEEAMDLDLPLSALEVVLGSDGLIVTSEYDVWTFILEWARAHYPRMEERREILTKHLMQYVCYSHMCSLRLREILACPDLDHEQVSKRVMEALLDKVESPYEGRHISTSCIRRCEYMHRPIKLVQIEIPRSHCVAYFDLKKEECEALFSKHFIMSQPIWLSGKWIWLVAQCIQQEQQTESHGFALYVQIEDLTQNCRVDVKFAAREKPSNKFRTHMEYNETLTPGHMAFGTDDLFLTSWTDFMRDDSPYFIDGVLHLRVKLAISISQD